jgi:hypothetical protein
MLSRDDLIARAKQISGWMSEPDLITLFELGTKHIKPNGFVIEIGVWKGLSTYILGSICKEVGATLYAIDTFAGVEDPRSYKNQESNAGSYHEALVNPEFYRIFLENVKGLPVVALKGDSRKVMKYIPNGIADMVFIDGNHNHPVIDKDIENGLLKIKPDGLLCGHDHGNYEKADGSTVGSDISEAVDKFLGKRWEGWNIYSSPDVVETTTSIWIKL